MSDLDAHYRFRDELADRLRADVLGPMGGPEETLQDPPASTYITGVLYPSRMDAESVAAHRREEDDDPTPFLAEDDRETDIGVSAANRQLPSSMGLTFAIDPALSPTVHVTVDVGVYEAVDASGAPVKAERGRRRAVDAHDAPLWRRRRPALNDPGPIDVTTPGAVVHTLASGLELRSRVREADASGAVAVTVVLVNTHTTGPQDMQDPFCFFQPEMRVAAEHGAAAFVERPFHEVADDEEEARASRLQHRHAPRFATGHGCAADWRWSPPPARGPRPGGPAVTDEVWTCVVPVYEVLLTESNPDVEIPTMSVLADSPTGEIVTALRGLTAGYRAWIADRRTDAEPLAGGEFAEVAAERLNECAAVCDRMDAGIALLERDDEVLTAFRRANRAMAEQRARTAWMRAGRVGEPDTEEGRWRPFQLGFLLLCLAGIADPDHDDRRIADLLWFPTGGGKTEAYLGLIALTVFLRRARKGARGAGVTVLMRYTLRLLTLQQFERAATLICAMELMRRRAPDVLGEEPVSIGMWVGRAATPNHLADAAASIVRLRDGHRLSEQNPVQLRSCPWCGTRIDAADHHVDLAAGRMSIECRDPRCPFRGGLPVHVVDEEIYAVRPTLVIATADKFAQMAWRGQVAALFNMMGAVEGTPPPELVIQDELHLISGPLGTLAGLYETAVDVAADGPKIIASTATIRRAHQQGGRLFDRGIRQFPPAGLDARDTWFSVEAEPADKASRLYVGLMAPATSQATLLIRAYAALLHHAHLVDGDDRVRDPYWTLLGYFGSLRLLAAAELQVHADVTERLGRLATRDGVHARRIDRVTELTSRVDSADIPGHLEELSATSADGGAIDVVLATNMISVGVDVDRLGLMAVMGQPQTTAEYIQATSRIGRRHPGLAVTLFNGARSRDRSHYEDFVAYHSALYRQVEATGVTPFAARARDRALHAMFVGLARLWIPAARPNDAAARVEDFHSGLLDLKEFVLIRVKAIAEDEHDATEKELDEFIGDWRRRARANPALVYEAPRRRRPGERRPADTALLASYGSDADLTDAWETMWSLRDVDVESDLYLEM